MAKLERKYLAHLLFMENLDTTNSTFHGDNATAGGIRKPSAWYRLGKGIEEYTVELGASTENKKDILGNNEINWNGYESTASNGTFYVEDGDALYAKLKDIALNRRMNDYCETYVADLIYDNTDSANPKWIPYFYRCSVIPQSIGGGTDGVQIPFNITYLSQTPVVTSTTPNDTDFAACLTGVKLSPAEGGGTITMKKTTDA